MFPLKMFYGILCQDPVTTGKGSANNGNIFQEIIFSVESQMIKVFTFSEHVIATKNQID